MCGIAGLVRFNSPAPRESAAAALRAMTDSIAHRGPDGEGIWVSDDGFAGLGHRRLAIVDLSAEANQPMHDVGPEGRPGAGPGAESGHDVGPEGRPGAESGLHLTFNGEIYNHLALRAELQAKGHKFRTSHSDTEVLIHGFKEWGLEGLVNRMTGMFAFAIWDSRTRRLSVARDRAGIKPVYFCAHDGVFRFASEIKAILSDPAVPRRVNPTALRHYLTFMVTPAPMTLFQGVWKLPAGYIMTVEADGRMAARRWWDALPGKSGLEQEIRTLPPESLEDRLCTEIRARFERGVERRMMTDVPFGVFLSGGIDSTANLAAMSQMTDQPVRTFTVGFKDHPRLNELEPARRAAKAFGADHHEVLIDSRDMQDYLGNLVHQQDEPIADWVCVPLYFVSKLARDSGVTVVQVGEGSDEQFAGYQSYMTYLRLGRLLNALPGAQALGALRPLAGMLARLTPGRESRLERIEETLSRLGRGEPLFWGGSNAFWEIHKNRYLNNDGAACAPEDTDPGVPGLDTEGLAGGNGGALISHYREALDEDADELMRMIHTEFRLRLPELLLMRVDKITMSTSVEARVPFLDHDLIDLTMDIPAAARAGGLQTKRLLKRAFKDLVPEDILNRPKMGFGAPAAEWLRGPFGHDAEAQILNSELTREGPLNGDYIRARFADHRAGKADNALHLWVLFNLAAWHDHWIAS